VVEHSNSRFESIRFDSLCESIRIDSFCKKIGLSIHLCSFFAYLLYSLSQKNKLTSLFAECNTSELHVVNLLEIIDTDMEPELKETPPAECISGKCIRLPNRIELNRIFFARIGML